MREKEPKHSAVPGESVEDGSITQNIRDAISAVKRAAIKLFSSNPDKIATEEAAFVREVQADIENAAIKTKIVQKMDVYKKEANQKLETYAGQSRNKSKRNYAESLNSSNLREHIRINPLIVAFLDELYDSYPQDENLWQTLQKFFSERVKSSQPLQGTLVFLNAFQDDPFLLRSFLKFILEEPHDSHAKTFLFACRSFYESDHTKFEQVIHVIKLLEQRSENNIIVRSNGVEQDDHYIMSRIGKQIKTYDEFLRATNFLLTYNGYNQIPEEDLLNAIKEGADN